MKKELFVEILGTDTSDILYDNYEVVIEEEIAYLRNKNAFYNHRKVCVYRLAHMCKEWALDQNVSISSTFKHTYGYAWVEWYVEYKNSRFGYHQGHNYKNEFQAETEPEAIFKACEWILENQSKPTN